MEGVRELYAEKDLKRLQLVLLRDQTLGQGARLAGALTEDNAVSRANDAREIEFVDGQKALHAAEKNGWTRFVSMQDHLNLIYREEEREMLPLCREEKIGFSLLYSAEIVAFESQVAHGNAGAV